MDSRELQELRQRFDQAVKLRKLSQGTAQRYQRTIRAYLMFIRENGAGQLNETTAAEFLRSERYSPSKLEQSFYGLKFLYIHVLRQNFKLRYNEIAKARETARQSPLDKIKRLFSIFK